MKLVSMKSEGEQDMAPSSPKYSYGLCISLDDDQCEALGIKGTIKPGTQVGLQALAVVTRVTEEIEEPGEGESTPTDIYLTLQITDLGLSAGQGGNAATTLYGED